MAQVVTRFPSGGAPAPAPRAPSPYLTPHPLRDMAEAAEVRRPIFLPEGTHVPADDAARKWLQEEYKKLIMEAERIHGKDAGMWMVHRQYAEALETQPQLLPRAPPTIRNSCDIVGKAPWGEIAANGSPLISAKIPTGVCVTHICWLGGRLVEVQITAICGNRLHGLRKNSLDRPRP